MMTGGESKHISLLKDFGLYPQAFLGALDAKEGLKMYGRVIKRLIKYLMKQKLSRPY